MARMFVETWSRTFLYLFIFNRHVPKYGSREILILMGSFTTVDPGGMQKKDNLSEYICVIIAFNKTIYLNIYASLLRQ